MPYGQVLRVKLKFSTIVNFKFITQNLNKSILRNDTNLAFLIKYLTKNEMLKERVREKPKQTCTPLTLTYNCLCLNISKVIQKHWNLLAINESLEEIFNCQPITEFKQNKNLKGFNRK